MPMPSLSFRDRLHLFRKSAIGLFSERAATSAYSLLAGLYPYVGAQVERGIKNTLDAYGTMPWLGAVSRKIGNAVSATQWQLLAPTSGKRNRIVQRAVGAERDRWIKQQVTAGDLRVIETHPLLDALTNANEYLVGSALLRVTQAHLDLVGEAFWIKERNGLGVPVGFWPIPPHWVLSTPTVVSRRYKVGWLAWQQEIPDTEILWMVDPDPANPYGRGRGMAQALADELETDEAAARHARMTLLNRARPDLIIYPKESKRDTGTISPENAERLAEAWRAAHQGPWRAGNPYFATREIGVQEVGQTFEELGLTKLREFERNTILQVYGMPPEEMGIVPHGALSRAALDCHSSDTECLTRAGWKSHDTLSVTDEIATWNEVAERLEYQQPSRVMRYQHDGEMHHWHTSRVDVLVTPNHRMWTKAQFSGGFEFRLSSDLLGKKLQQRWRATGGGYAGQQVTDVVIPAVPYHGRGKRGHEPDGSCYRLSAETFAPFLGHYISEGSVADPFADQKTTHNSFDIRLSQNIGPRATLIADSVRALNMGQLRESVVLPTEGNLATMPSLAFSFANKSLWYWLKAQCGCRALEKRLPREVFDWPVVAQRLLLDGLMLGDGNNPTRPTRSTAEFVGRNYGTASKQLADDVQQLCIQLGLRASVHGAPSGHPSGTWMYTVGISSKQHVFVTTSGIGGDKRSPESPVDVVPYCGMVWCVEVPNGLFFTRRNGKVICHGNSVDYLFKKNLIVSRIEFLRQQIQERIIPEYDDRLVLTYVSPVAEDQDRYLAAAKEAPWALQIDEWRALAGRPALPGGKGQVHLVPQTLVPTADPTIPRPPAIIAAPGGVAPAVPARAWSAEWHDAVEICREAGDVASVALIERASSGASDDLPELSRRVARQEGAVRRLWSEQFAALRARVDLAALERAVATQQAHHVLQAIPIAAWAETLAEPARAFVTQAFLVGARYGAETAQVTVQRDGGQISFTLVNAEAVAWAKAHAAALIRELETSTLDGVRAIIAEALGGQLTAAQAVRLIREGIALTDRQARAVARFEQTLRTQGVPDEKLANRVARYAEAQRKLRASTIARTEIQRGAHQGQQRLWEIALEKGYLKRDETFKSLSVADDERLCRECEAIGEDDPVPIDEPFASGDMMPPIHPDCLPGDSLVLSGGRISAVSKRWYEGDVVIIRTARGQQLACTPNHPILTDRGWLAARLVYEGAQVIGGSVGELVNTIDDHDVNVPTRIEKIADAYRIAHSSSRRAVISAAKDFHGDGLGGEIAVVWADRQLRDRGDVSLLHGVGHEALQRSYAWPCLIRLGTLQFFLQSLGDAGRRHMRCLDEMVAFFLRQARPSTLVAFANGSAALVGGRDLGGPLVWRHALPACFRGRFARFTRMIRRPSRYMMYREKVVNATTAYAVPSRQEMERFAGQIVSDQVVGIEWKHMASHVYNLETATGWYMAQGMITHNCRCSVSLSFERVAASLAPAMVRVTRGTEPWQEAVLAGVGPLTETVRRLRE